MKFQPVICAVIILAVGLVSPLLAQVDEIKLDPVQAKITTVSAMRARTGPKVTAAEVVRLKLGTVVNAVARSTNQDTIGGKTDYWYRVNLPNGQPGWLFGGLMLDYTADRRHELLRQIIEARLKAETTAFADRQEIYNLAASAVTEAKDVNTRAEFELLKLLALAGVAVMFPDELSAKSPYREWLKTHAGEVFPDEFAGGYTLRSELLWDLEAKYHALPIADRIAWAAANNPQPSDCEGDEVCHFFLGAGVIRYLSLHANGAHASQAVKDLTAVLTDEVIKSANDKGGDKYAVEQRNDLRKLLASLRLAVAKTSVAEKTELLKKLERISPGNG